MGKLKNYVKYLKNPYRLFILPAVKGRFDKMSDEKYLKRLFRAYTGRKLDLEDPKTFNEKLQWLKLNDRNPLYTTLVDKYLVREYVKDRIGEEYLIPLLGVWDRAEDIDFDKLPNEFVLKCNHNSGKGMYICKDKSALSGGDIERIRSDLNEGLKQDYYLFSREWPYKDVPRKIIAEKYLSDGSDKDLKDYKFMCFGGKTEMMFIVGNRWKKNEDITVDFFDPDFNRLPFSRDHDNSREVFVKPDNFNRMIELSEKLSQGFPFVRVDLYDLNGKIYFGELTFFPGSGFERFQPDEWDKKIGDMLVLPKKT